MQTVDQYGIFELLFTSGDEGPVVGEGIFSKDGKEYRVKGFKDGDAYRLRFMPGETGVWNYTVRYGGAEEAGSFRCAEAPAGIHGPVRATGFHFRYDDGERYLPFGTTCYAWTHQSEETQEATLRSLDAAPFNKLRMCIFPKHMPYNHNEPECFPFRKKADGTWNVYEPDPRFWRHLEKRVAELAEKGIEADLILFHPYDRWGFSTLSMEENLVYLDYCVARLAAYRNVWWSLANEYDVVTARKTEDWNRFGSLLAETDPYHHLISIHQCFTPFPKADWMTHCSMQTGLVRNALLWREEYQRPVIIDECGYEGDIEFGWGNLSAFELVHRCWTAVCAGAYVTHGETFYREDEVLWWAKGGVLRGESVVRLRFLKDVLSGLPRELDPFPPPRWLPNPNESKPKSGEDADGIVSALLKMPEAERNRWRVALSPAVVESPDYRLEYLGRTCPAFWDLELSEKGRYRVEIIDVWEMTRRVFAEEASGRVRVTLPAKEGIALLITHLSGEE
ncbi:MAG: DUF4038 domain-containing protein [Spirochaetaceae bacterium]|jgi:hypothetical protein|nr:DUF4038 domain-containing protein [Spirochaetaceae bacterium]